MGNQSELIFKIYCFLRNSGVCPDTNPSEWVRTLLYLHTKGWLYTVLENDEPTLVVAMYRLKSFDERNSDKMPEKEEGSVLYIPFFASNGKQHFKALKILKQFIKKHDIKEVFFYNYKKGQKLRHFIIGGLENGKKQNAVVA